MISHSARSGSRRLSFAGMLLGGLAVLPTTGCGGDGTAPAPAPAPPSVPKPAPDPGPPTMRYNFSLPEVRISPRVPGSLPEGVAFAPAIALVAHPRDFTPFSLGQPASDGLEVLAETGASELFLEGARAAAMKEIAASFGELLAIFLSPDPSIEMHPDRPCLTYAQRIAPSPDWFIGFSNVCATDESGAWLDEIRADLIAYDAGTAAGDEFADKAEGGDTEPRDPVSHLDRPPHFVPPAVVQVLRAARKTDPQDRE